ncbi:hypothetical protein PQR53_01850 [Paraburkholderia fungorum]|uniref:hypothetical protein n=1 Tax=Paraburkholderia fungorum TaxID=134537 RepID=UPI0038BAB352
MTTLSSLNASLPPAVTPLSNTGNSLAATVRASQGADTGTSSTIVTIPSLVVAAPLLYTQQGILAGVEPTVTWAQSNTDAVSLVMAVNYTSGTTAGQFNNLGSALLDRFKTTDSDFSQSVTVGSADASGATGGVGASSHGPQDHIRLTIQTASGVEVDIKIDSGDGTLGVSVQSGGTLSDAERSALAKLADGFQNAIDGLSAAPPKLDLSGLTQFDPSVLASVDMQFNVTGAGQNNISAEFSQNSSAKSVSLTDSAGTVNLKVDTSDSAIWGSGAQRDQAIASYLAQFDNANAKGHGNKELMSIFKDAFTQMNSDYGDSTQQLPGTAYAPWLAQSDQAMLTGLGDFSASITDTAESSNPLLPNQKDTFSYQVSQSTSTKGDLMNGAISQNQQSHLRASYHEALSGGPVELSLSPESQNYNYIQISDDASSTVKIQTERGNLILATLNQTSSQSIRQSQYVRGMLTSDVTTPSSTTTSKDLQALLTPLFADNEAEQNTPAWQQALSRIHGMILLNAGAN